MSTLAMAILGVILFVIAAIVTGVIGNDAHAMLPALTKAIVRLAARIDANHPDEVDGICAENLAGINDRVGEFGRAHLPALVLALGLLLRVALARRTTDAARATYCAVRLRIALWWSAIQRMRKSPTTDGVSPQDDTAKTCLKFILSSNYLYFDGHAGADFSTPPKLWLTDKDELTGKELVIRNLSFHNVNSVIWRGIEPFPANTSPPDDQAGREAEGPDRPEPS